ncbi:hypothetical protein AAZX31_02G202300 [Glycine max]
MASQAVELRIEDNQVIMDNGILQVYLSNLGGLVTRIQYNGIDNLLEVLSGSEYNYDGPQHPYWDVVWSEARSIGTIETFERIVGTSFNVVSENEEQVEISFTRKWNPSLKGKRAPLNIDKRYAMLRNSTGFYSYAIFEHLKEWPAFNIPQIRIVYKLRKDKSRKRGKKQVPPEAVLLVNPVEPEFKGEVDDKYQYSSEIKDLMVHGWISSQSETDPAMMFLSAHYAGEDMVLKLQPNKPWKKVFGPSFVYLNTLLDGDDSLELWEDAKYQEEVQRWPYDFPTSEGFQKSSQRDSLCGTLLIRDRKVEMKAYRFRRNEEGNFSIDNIRNGDYNLYAWVPGFIEEYWNNVVLTITQEHVVKFGDIIFEPPRDGPTLWEIDIPDRSAAGFYVPDPNPKYINKLFVNQTISLPIYRFRQYGLWERYAELYPNEDLIYFIQWVSVTTQDWFFAHVTGKQEDGSYQGTTWQIKFNLDDVETSNIYRLRLALASANISELQDNAIARHGIHGLYWLFSIDVPGLLLEKSINIIFLTQTMASGPLVLFQGIMYDYIRLEETYNTFCIFVSIITLFVCILHIDIQHWIGIKLIAN